MNQTSDELYLKLNQGPAFLLLGQNYLRLESGTDSFLSEVLRKFGKIGTEPPHYGQILEGEAQNAIEPALAWMQQRCERFSLPEWLKTVASFEWNGVYTSAIDAIWSRAFRSEWRELQRIFEEKIKFGDPRNRSRLHCTFLFGCVDKTEEAERPPLTEFELDERELIAVSLARRLPELITPFGVLVIEGYAGAKDWLSPKILFQVINELNTGQAYIFSATDELSQDRYISELVKRGKLVLKSEGLASYFLRGQKSGFLRLGKRPEEEKHGRRIRIEGSFLTVPSSLWNQVFSSAMILDDTVFLTQKISKERRYSEFGSFLAESSIKPVWSGYERGFAFHREFEDLLRTEVDKKLKSNELKGEPIILHGQTGTGKTIALGSLAYSIRKEKKHPVLFIERKPQKPLSSDIDAFCQWAEDHGAPTTLVVWDGMVEHEQYYTLLRDLEGRGRKVVLVGSCYRIEPEEIARNKRRSFVEAPPCLTSTEIPKFIQFLNSFDSSLGQSPRRWIEEGGNRFLVVLYRLLFPSRSRIRSGLDHEVGFYEKEIVSKSKKVAPEPKTTLGLALLKAGKITQEHLFSSETEELGGEEVNQLQKLVGLVMVPGRFGINIPLELLIRAIGKEGVTNFVSLLKKINTDIIQWYPEPNGNIAVGPRHSLEAQLIVQSRLGTAKTEIAFAKELLIEVRESSNFFDDAEVQFAVELVRQMGPNSSDSKYFADYFLELSKTLSQLREERGVQNPRLMLQEATLLRESVKEKSQSGTPPENTEELLDQAETILNHALELLGDDRRNNKQRSFFLTELASVLGTKFQHILKKHPEKSIQFFKKARELSFKAWTLDSENYRPVDILSWTTEALLERPDILDSKSRAEAEADILHAFTMAEAEDFDAVQQVLFNKRRMDIGRLIGNQKLSDEAFESLRTLGSSAGYYLRAYNIVRDLFKNLWPFETELSSEQCDVCRAAAEYLEENRQAVSQDGRSLYLLLRVWWMWKTRKPIFYGERQTVPFTKEDWQYCLRVVEELMAAGAAYNKPLLTYLRGLATFHLDRVQNALDIFKELERESDKTGRRRIIRSYLASTSDGQPRKYSGEVAWRVEDPFKAGGVEVTQLRLRIHFIPQDFNRPNIRRGESLDEFHIAFNFLGPIADPIGYFKLSRQGKS